MKILLLAILTGFCLSIHAQSVTVTSSATDVGNFVLKDTNNNQVVFTYKATFNADKSVILELLLIDNKDLLILPNKNAGEGKPGDTTKTDTSRNATKKDGEKATITSNSAKFSVYKFDANKDVFIAYFQNTIKSLSSSISTNNINEECLILYGELRTKMADLEDAPRTAYLKLLTSKLKLKVALEKVDATNQAAKAKGKDVTANPSNSKEFYIMANISQVDIEFEDGTLKNILVSVKPTDGSKLDPLDDGVVEFRNAIPIGVSGKFSRERLSNMTIYAFDPCRAGNVLTPPPPGRDCNFENVSFQLSDLIDYRILLELSKENYAPANQVVSLTLTEHGKILKKELKSKLFDIRTYTDLVGLGADQPNGLIQIEGRKKIFISENLVQSPFRTYFGYAKYLEPVVRFAKLDNNNRNFIPDTAGSGAHFNTTKQKILNVNALDVYSHQLRSAILNFNLLHLSAPQLKFNIEFNCHLGVYQTSIADSLGIRSNALVKLDKQNVTTVNTALYGLTGMVNFFPDSRYSITLGTTVIANHLMHPEYHQTGASGIFSCWADGSFKSTETSTIFIRGAFNMQARNASLNYVQVQLGGSFSIFGANSK